MHTFNASDVVLFYLYYCDLGEELRESGSLIGKTLSTLSPERYLPKVQCGQYLIYESVVAPVLQIFYYSTLTESRCALGSYTERLSARRMLLAYLYKIFNVIAFVTIL